MRPEIANRADLAPAPQFIRRSPLQTLPAPGSMRRSPGVDLELATPMRDLGPINEPMIMKN